MDPATAIVIGTLEPSPLVWRWLRRAVSAGAEICRPRKEARTERYAAGRPIDMEALEPVDGTIAPMAGGAVYVMLASRNGREGDGVVAGLSGDEFVVLMPADDQAPPAVRPAAKDSPEAGRAWVALVSLAGRLRNTTPLEPATRGREQGR